MEIKTHQLIICHDTHPNNYNDNYEHPNKINNIDTDKKVITEIMIRSIMLLIKAIQILTTSTTFHTTKVSKTLIQRTILIMSSYVIIANAIKVFISFKNMVNICHMIFNSFNNLTLTSSKESSNTLISEKNNARVEY